MDDQTERKVGSNRAASDVPPSTDFWTFGRGVLPGLGRMTRAAMIDEAVRAVCWPVTLRLFRESPWSVVHESFRTLAGLHLVDHIRAEFARIAERERARGL